MDQGRAFRLDGVRITFHQRTETTTTLPDGRRQTVVKLIFWFTDDFWSEKNKFYGKGGKDLPTYVVFVRTGAAP